MEWVETSGKTIEEARELALDQLGVDEDDAEFEVLSEPKGGLLSRFRAEARVRARVRPSIPRAKDSGNQRRRRRSESKDRPDRNDEGATSGASTLKNDVEQVPPPTSRESSQSKSRGRPVVANKQTANKQTEGAFAMEDTTPLADQGEVAKNFLNGLLGEINASTIVSVAVDDEEETISMSIEGDNLGYLIGPRGATLSALQEVTRIVVQRQTGARNGRLLVDVSRYREKRRTELERFSRQVAQEVLESGSSRTVEPMNAADRKVVHDVISTIDGVATVSEGEDPRRRVVVNPARSED